MILMACINTTIVNVALPTMAKEMGLDMGSVSWVVAIYLIGITATILIYGKLADLYGKPQIFIFGVGLFTFGSLLCGLAPSLPILLAARVIQAAGAAATMATNQGLISQVFPLDERGRALGLSGSAVALGSMLGPALGGIIISGFSWHYIFWVNIPIGIAALLMSFRIFPQGKKKVKENKEEEDKFDGFGSLLYATSISLFFLAMNIGQRTGFGNAWTMMAVGVSMVLFGLFLRTERRRQAPMLDLRIFENKLFSLSIFSALINFTVIASTFIILPFYFQNTLHMSPSLAGLYMMTSPIVLSIVSPISGYISDKIGPEPLAFLGLCISAWGFIAMGLAYHETTSRILIIALMAFMSLGSAIFQAPNTSLTMSTVSRDKLGIAGSVNGLSRNVGLVCGVTFSTTLLYNRMSSRLGYRVQDYVAGREDAFVYAMKIVFLTAGGLCLIPAALMGLRLLRRRWLQTNSE